MIRRRQTPRVFLCYRREDASGHAGRLYDDLVDRFGSENVFIDVDTIGVGADFGEAIARAVASCDALIALIGRDWLAAADETGRRRLDDPEDFVRLELETAFARDVPVVPVSVRGASFPDEDDLPGSLAPLARRQGAELRDVGWRDDVRRLVEQLENLVRPAERRRKPWWRSRGGVAALAGTVVAVVAAVVAVAALRTGDDGAAFPNAAERKLLAFVPPITRPTCARIDWGDEAASAAVQCGAAGVAATYNLFESEQVRDSWYERTRDEAGVSPSSGNCTPQAFKGETTYGAAESERYACWFDGAEPLLAWKHGPNAVGARANNWQRKGEAGAETLLRQWRCCLAPQS